MTPHRNNQKCSFHSSSEGLWDRLSERSPSSVHMTAAEAEYWSAESSLRPMHTLRALLPCSVCVRVCARGMGFMSFYWQVNTYRDLLVFFNGTLLPAAY